MGRFYQVRFATVEECRYRALWSRRDPRHDEKHSSKMKKISVIIPCKDEIDNIEACIASARRIADEILVADSGSTDGTLERARVLADRVVAREYIDSGNFKNWAIPQAKYEWILIVDADERVTADLASEIRERLEANESYLAYSVPRRNFFLGHPLDHGDWARDRVTRLIQRDHCRYQLATDHAEIRVPRSRLGKLTSKLIHYTAWEVSEYIERMTHYADQQAGLWYSEGRTPKWYHVALNAPLRFARSYIFRMGFLDGAIGFHLACTTAYYSFLKQFLLWQRYHCRPQRELDASYAASRVSVGVRRAVNKAGSRKAA